MAETANSSLISSSILRRRVILAILAVILQWSKSVWAQGTTIETIDDIKSKYLCQNIGFLNSDVVRFKLLNLGYRTRAIISRGLYRVSHQLVLNFNFNF